MTPTSKVIDGSDTKLEIYQDLRNSLATGIFAALVDSDKLKEKKEEASDSSADQTSLRFQQVVCTAVSRYQAIY